MRKFIVDFEGEEEYEEDHGIRLTASGGMPAILYMVTGRNTDFVERMLTTIGDMCDEDIPYVRVKYQRDDSDAARFGIGFTPEAVRQPGVIDCLNKAGRAHLGSPYHYVIYYDDRIIGSFADVMAEFPWGLGRSTNTAAKSELLFIDIVEV